MSEHGENRLREILPQLNTNQLRFLSIRNECSSDKEAAELLGLAEGTVYQWEEKEIIREALKLMLFDGVIVASEILRRNLPKAAAVKVAGLQSDDERIRQLSAAEIIDRLLGKPTQRTENKQDGELKVTVEYVTTKDPTAGTA